eukprot:scaffold8080_cov417-Prasinococcus_capsulatus_cf.AAC.2
MATHAPGGPIPALHRYAVRTQLSSRGLWASYDCRHGRACRLVAGCSGVVTLCSCALYVLETYETATTLAYYGPYAISHETFMLLETLTGYALIPYGCTQLHVAA